MLWNNLISTVRKRSVAANTSYSTSFPTTENPLSEGGRWFSNSTTRTRCQTTPGLCFGTMTSTSQPPFDDSYAGLTGTWGPDVEIIMTIAKASPFGIQEIEANFRIQDTVGQGNVIMYEVNLAHDGQYCNFGRWTGPNGSISDFVELAPSSGGVQFSVPGGVHNGDLFKATMIGNAMNAYINYNDGNGYHIINTNGPILDTAGAGGGAVITSGAPGIGFYDEAQHSGANNQFGISHLQVTVL
jgi:hypothetical protein